jgi:hypothetical protein
MQNNTKYGKVTNYDGYTGEIVTEDNLYYFNRNDIVKNNEIIINDIVMFNSKSEDIFPQAYNIKKVEIKEN